MLDALFYQREEPVAIVGALATSYVDMVRVRAALEHGGSYGDAAQYGDYKGKDFRLKKAQQNVPGGCRCRCCGRACTCCWRRTWP